MSSIMLLGLVFTLCLATGQSKFEIYNPDILLKNRDCINPPVVQNFQKSKFFNGYWYKQLSFGNLLPKAVNICPTIGYKIDQNQIQVVDYYYDQKLKKYFSLRGTSDCIHSKETEGYCLVNFPYLGETVNLYVPMFIVGTDYENWAVMYSCKQIPFRKMEASWVMSRNRTNWVITDDIKQVMTKAGLHLDEYEKSANDDCPPNEPHV